MYVHVCMYVCMYVELHVITVLVNFTKHDKICQSSRFNDTHTIKE